MNEIAREIALRTAVIATHFMYKKFKIGNEGIIMHYDLCVEIAEKSLVKFPMDFDWENEREKEIVEDFDVEIEKFAEELATKEYHIDKTYFV